MKAWKKRRRARHQVNGNSNHLRKLDQRLNERQTIRRDRKIIRRTNRRKRLPSG
jgi:predicted RNA polymerase sigma factor